MHNVPFAVLVVALYWVVSRAMRLTAIVFRVILAVMVALLLLRGWL